MRGAIEIARYFTAHMLALCGAEDLSPEADAVLKVLRRCGLKTFSHAYVRRKVQDRRALSSAEAVMLALSELVTAGYICPHIPEKPAENSRGRPSGPSYRLVE